MFIFGIFTNEKVLGNQGKVRCGLCNNIGVWSIIKITTWCSFFFIPLIPLKTKYIEQCPICHGSTELTKAEVMELLKRGG